MRIIAAVIVYDRFYNVESWIRCWKMSDTQGAELFIIHNYKNNSERSKYYTFCQNQGVNYVPRQNVGMDIGAFQDVCRGRLIGFPNQWDYLFWAADDTLPMSKTFLSPFIESIKNPNVGVACLEISKEVKTHIRTTGFILSQLTASKVEFPAKKIVTKAQCYEFEHRSKNAFYEQIIKMRKKVVQVVPDIAQGGLWDTGNRGFLNRWDEHYREFPK